MWNWACALHQVYLVFTPGVAFYITQSHSWVGQSCIYVKCMYCTFISYNYVLKVTRNKWRSFNLELVSLRVAEIYNIIRRQSLSGGSYSEDSGDQTEGLDWYL